MARVIKKKNLINMMGTVIDFTAYKLESMAKALDNVEDAMVVLEILEEYYKGEIAIAWEEGQPVIMPTTAVGVGRGIPAGFSMVSYDAEQIEGDEGGEG